MPTLLQPSRRPSALVSSPVSLSTPSPQRASGAFIAFVRSGVAATCDALLTRLGRAWCGVTTRHRADLLQFDGKHMHLRCAECGRQTAGWSV